RALVVAREADAAAAIVGGVSLAVVVEVVIAQQRVAPDARTEHDAVAFEAVEAELAVGRPPGPAVRVAGVAELGVVVAGAVGVAAAVQTQRGAPVRGRLEVVA